MPDKYWLFICDKRSFSTTQTIRFNFSASHIITMYERWYKLSHWYHKSLDLFLRKHISWHSPHFHVVDDNSYPNATMQDGRRKEKAFVSLPCKWFQTKSICLMYRMVIVKGFCLNDASTTRIKLSSIYYFLCMRWR